MPETDLKPERLPPTANRSNIIPFAVLAAVVVALGVFFYKVVQPLLLPLFLAAVTAMLISPLYLKFVQWYRGRKSLAAFTVIFLLFISVLAPMITAAFIGWREFSNVSATLQKNVNIQDWLHPEDSPKLAEWKDKLKSLGPVDPDQVWEWLINAAQQAAKQVADKSLDILGNIPGFMLAMFMFLIALFYFLVDGESIVQGWERLTPMDSEHDRVLRLEFSKVCRAVVWATLIAAIVQAILFGVGLTVVELFAKTGVGKWIFLLSMLTLIFSLIPMIGAAAVWIPLSIILALRGHTGAAIVIAIYCAAIVSQADNVIKIFVLQGSANLHPLLVFVCVFGGMQLVGILGVFIGPIVGAVLFALMKILKRELLEMSPPPIIQNTLAASSEALATTSSESETPVPVKKAVDSL